MKPSQIGYCIEQEDSGETCRVNILQDPPMCVKLKRCTGYRAGSIELVFLQPKMEAGYPASEKAGYPDKVKA